MCVCTDYVEFCAKFHKQNCFKKFLMGNGNGKRSTKTTNLCFFLFIYWRRIWCERTQQI